jgi:membrane-bound lytic murein transglycosylase B
MQPTLRKALGQPLLAFALLTAAGSAAADYSQHPKVPALLTALQNEHGFSASDLDAVRAALAQANTIPSLIEAEQKAPERTETWTVYSAKRVDALRIKRGAQFIHDNRALLDRAETEYGVPGPVIAGVLGLETNFGRITGGARVLDALTTQGFDHPTRSAFFFEELEQYFVFCRDFGFDPTQPKGSYAGAMGWAQFMPSNYRRLAVDFDGNGKRDLWSAPDAIGSIANYFVEYKPELRWHRGEPLVVPAKLKKPLPDSIVPNAKNVGYTVAQLRSAGVEPGVRLPANLAVGLIELQLDAGSAPAQNDKEYWIGLPNFYSVMSYNPRVYYAMTVSRLASAMATEAAKLDPDAQ